MSAPAGKVVELPKEMAKKIAEIIGGPAPPRIERLTNRNVYVILMSGRVAKGEIKEVLGRTMAITAPEEPERLYIVVYERGGPEKPGRLEIILGRVREYDVEKVYGVSVELPPGTELEPADMEKIIKEMIQASKKGKKLPASLRKIVESVTKKYAVAYA